MLIWRGGTSGEDGNYSARCRKRGQKAVFKWDDFLGRIGRRCRDSSLLRCFFSSLYHDLNCFPVPQVLAMVFGKMFVMVMIVCFKRFGRCIFRRINARESVAGRDSSAGKQGIQAYSRFGP